MSVGNALSLDSATAVAASYADHYSMQIDDAAVRETSCGWYFPWLWSDMPEPGSNGIVVNKETGKVFALGSAFSVDRDLRFYDKGYQAELYDLVVSTVNDIDQAIDHLLRLEPTTTTPQYDSGAVWRIAQRLTKDEIRDRLTQLPCVFPDIKLYHRLEILDEAENDGSFEFQALPRTTT